MMRRSVIAILLVMLGACYPATTRPTFVPMPEAPTKEMELFIPEATQQLAIALNNDSFPVRRTEPRDGWLETEWFDATTMQPTKARRLGDNVVKIRAWIGPSRPNYSWVTIEAVYRPLADPSREDRALEQVLPSGHPIAMKVFKILDSLARRYSDEKQ
jgi:hypothetical protein